MRKSTPILLSALFLVALNISAASVVHARRLPAALLASPSHVVSVAGDTETDRSRDGLQGPVRRVRTETSKLMSKGGKLTEGARVVLETATYDMKGAKIDTAYFLGAGGSLTGKEVYKYDDRGNIVEMTLFNTDGSVLSKEKYDYEFDAMGNWTRMTTSVAVIENGQMSFEPTEVTYRVIAYYLEDATAKKLQTASLANNTNAAATVSPAVLTDNKPAANVSAPVPAPAKSEPAASQPKLTAAPANSNVASPKSNAAVSTPNAAASNNASATPVKHVTNAPAPPASSGAPAAAATTALSLGMPNAATLAASNNTSSAPVVKTNDDVPPPPVKPAVRASLRPVSGGVLNGKAVEMPKPVYPEAARRSKLGGVVTVEVVIDASGKVIGARAVSGPEMLRDAAERAARMAKFTPALLSGQPVRVSGIINYNFSL
ncbi:MAG: periplasmic protein TonB [Pyrinomonadaceae bacterium]|nr:periplasmic protein TonB [Pyrinomonadaceae bacterium]